MKFGERSLKLLNTCHPKLVELGLKAIETSPFDFACTDGLRDAETQNQKFLEGLTKVQFSKHQQTPSEAVHFEPYPIMYPQPTDAQMTVVKKYARYYMLALHVMQTAKDLGITIRWGGDWDGDGDIMDQTFDDLAHFELKNP